MERGEGREKERERKIGVWEIHQSIASCKAPAGDLARNPGMCREQESTGDLLARTLALNPLSHTNQGHFNHFKVHNFVAFSTCTMLCNHQHYLVPKHFYYPKKELYPLAVTPHDSAPIPQQPLIYFLTRWIGLFWTFHIDGIIQCKDGCLNFKRPKGT